MKKNPKFQIIALIFTTLLLITSSYALAGDCYHVTSEATGTADEPLGQYYGIAEVEMAGINYVANVTATPGQPRQTEDGTLHLETITVFDFSEYDSIETIEKVVLSATDEAGVYRVNSQMIITNGTGSFAGAFGKLSPHGYIDFNDPNFAVLAKGKICW